MRQQSGPHKGTSEKTRITSCLIMLASRLPQVTSRPFPDLKIWFQTLYEILLGQSQGPRMGSFFALYGLKESRALIKQAIAGEDFQA